MIKRNLVISTGVKHAPNVLSKGVPHLPKWLTFKAIERGLNHVLQKDLEKGALDFLRSASVHVNVTDIGLAFSVRLEKQNAASTLIISATDGEEDVYFAGKMNYLWLLITQSVDPDTLFFRRQLLLRGDTELGLAIKNFLDTVEIEERMPGWVYALAMDVSTEIEYQLN